MSDGSDADAVERCCTRSLFDSRVTEGTWCNDGPPYRTWGERGPYFKFAERWKLPALEPVRDREGVLREERVGETEASTAELGVEEPASMRLSSPPVAV